MNESSGSELARGRKRAQTVRGVFALCSLQPKRCIPSECTLVCVCVCGQTSATSLATSYAGIAATVDSASSLAIIEAASTAASAAAATTKTAAGEMESNNETKAHAEMKLTMMTPIMI